MFTISMVQMLNGLRMLLLIQKTPISNLNTTAVIFLQTGTLTMLTYTLGTQQGRISWPIRTFSLNSADVTDVFTVFNSGILVSLQTRLDQFEQSGRGWEPILGQS